MIRAIANKDLEQIKEIHEKYYKTEFDFPNFVNKYLCAFVVADEDSHDIISVGGIRTIVESIAITNKDFSPRIRKKALTELLYANVHFTEKHGYNEIHAFVQDPEWEHHLRKVGFETTKGKCLVLSL